MFIPFNPKWYVGYLLLLVNLWKSLLLWYKIVIVFHSCSGKCKFSVISCASSNGREPESSEGGIKGVEKILEEKRRAELSARIASGEFTVKDSGYAAFFLFWGVVYLLFLVLTICFGFCVFYKQVFHLYWRMDCQKLVFQMRFWNFYSNGLMLVKIIQRFLKQKEQLVPLGVRHSSYPCMSFTSHTVEFLDWLSDLRSVYCYLVCN